jgi:acyl-coenzyme A synthetase/AMP-(fatty) acid ligase
VTLRIGEAEQSSPRSEERWYVAVSSASTGKLPAFKLPRKYTLVAELPRTTTGKIQRYKLRAELQRSA